MQARVIPRHVGVIPAEVGQHAAIGRRSWRRVEVGAGRHNTHRPVQPHRNQLVARFAVAVAAVVVLTHPDRDGFDAVADWVLRVVGWWHQRWVGVSQPPRDVRFWGHRTRRGLSRRVEQPHPVIAHAAGQHEMAAVGCCERQPGATAVFVDGSADVCLRGAGHVGGLCTGLAEAHPHHGTSPAVEGSLFRPVGPIARYARLGPAHSTRGDVGRLQRRRPRTMRKLPGTTGVSGRIILTIRWRTHRFLVGSDEPPRSLTVGRFRGGVSVRSGFSTGP